MTPRVAFLLTQDKGGPVDVTVALAAELAGGGHAQVRVFGPPPARGAELLGDLLAPIEVPNKAALPAARAARAALRAWRPDVVHAQDRRSGLVVTGLDRTGGGPRAVVHTYHGVPDDVTEPWFRGTPAAPGPSRYTKAVLGGDAVVARAVSATVVPSPAMGRFLRERLRVPAARIVHIDNAVDLPDPHPPTGPVRRLLFVGLLVERKGVADLLAALNLLAALDLPDAFPADAHLTIAGDGPERERLEKQVAGSGLAGRVDFLGFRTDVPALLTEADALVLPSRMEQQPLVVAEAMAAGKPVLATDCGGVADMLTVPGARSWLAAPGDIPALAAQLRSLFAEPDPGTTGRLLAEQARRRFTVATCAAEHLRLYRRLLGS